MPKDWKKKYPEFCISQLPGVGIVNNESVESGYINYIDDNYLVIDDSDSKKMDLFWACFFLCPWILAFIIGVFKLGFTKEFLFTSIIFTCISFPPAIWFFVKAYYLNKERKLIFDRQRGLVQVPGSYQESSQLIKFSELHVVLALQSRFQGGVHLLLTKNKTFADKYLGSGILLPFVFAKALQSWSYFVWYMDKNRPLPPGTALDPYRQKDYERRKAEGFPEPLHPSYIETPEHFTDEYKLMNEKNRTIPGRYGDCLNDNYVAKVKAYQERKRKEDEELSKKHWAYQIIVKVFKFLKSL